jgi:hypothetical protein
VLVEACARLLADLSVAERITSEQGGMQAVRAGDMEHVHPQGQLPMVPFLEHVFLLF